MSTIRTDIVPLASLASPELCDAMVARFCDPLVTARRERLLCDEAEPGPPHTYVLRDGRILEPAEAHGLALPFVSGTK